MTQLMYEGDPLEIKGLFCVYMAGSVECALRQHPECMNADDCLFHRTDPGCGIERFYRQLAEGETPMMRNVNCRSDQARILVRSLVDCKGDFPEMIFGPPPGNNPDSFWVDLTEDQKNVLRAAYADAFGKLYGGKKIMVVDPGHDEGSRAAAAACKVQGGALVIEAIVDNTDNSPNRNEDVILTQEKPGNPLLESTKAFEQHEILESGLQQRRDREMAVLKEEYKRSLVDIIKTFRNRGSTEFRFTREDWDNRKPQTEEDRKEMEQLCYEMGQETQQLYLNSMKGLGEDKSIEIIPADETARIRSGITADSTEIDGAIDILEHWDKVTKEFDFVEGYKKNKWKDESCTLTRKSLRALKRSWGLDGKSLKRFRKKQEQEINRRDRKFRDRTRKLKRLLEYQIRSLEFVFQGPPFGNKNPVITMDRRYNFPDVPNRAIEHIRNNAFNFLELE